MKSIAIDSKSHQAIRHLGSEAKYGDWPRAGGWQNVRLSGLESDLSERGFLLKPIPLTKESLEDIEALIIAGRSEHFPFSCEELGAIKSFVTRGGGLFLMANHKGFTAPQNQVAEVLQLPVTFYDVWVTKLTPEIHPAASHPILSNPGSSLQLRVACKMALRSAKPIPFVIDKDPKIGTIMAAINRTNTSKGRVVISTSAGHIASLDDAGRDLYSHPTNKALTLSIIEWLTTTTS